jgi:hypothetical protein
MAEPLGGASDILRCRSPLQMSDKIPSSYSYEHTMFSGDLQVSENMAMLIISTMGSSNAK